MLCSIAPAPAVSATVPSAVNPSVGAFPSLEDITDGRTYWGEYAFPIDLDGDGALDFVHSDLRPGPDGDYGTGDEVSELIPTFVARE